MPPTVSGEHIKEGDELRFCWSFKDQDSGFRDFSDGVFGRRRNQYPPELVDSTLYMKLPWPRFEVSGTSCSMVMAPIASTEPAPMDLKVLLAAGGQYRYSMQDVIFWIDTVPNRGYGGLNDYMMRSVVQKGD